MLIKHSNFVKIRCVNTVLSAKIIQTKYIIDYSPDRRIKFFCVHKVIHRFSG